MAQQSPGASRRKTILVVDDEPGMRALFSFMLGAKGYGVHTAGSGQEALQSVQGSPYDLVFLDVRMPYMDGLEILRALKQIRPNVPVIMMTGYAVEQLLNDAMREGAKGYLRKPFTIEELMNSIEGTLATGHSSC